MRAPCSFPIVKTKSTTAEKIADALTIIACLVPLIPVALVIYSLATR